MNWDMAREVGTLEYILRRLSWRVLRLRGRPVSFRLPDGASVLLPLESPFAADIHCTRGYVDWGAEQLLARYLQTQPRGVCVDVGANMGYYSCLLAPHAVEVLAFEPDPRNHAALQAQNIPNLTLIPKAVSDTVGTASFDVSSASTVGHLGTRSDSTSQIQVETTTLDECWKQHGKGRRVTAIKMDVEGYEILGLRGAGRLIEACQPVFLIEFGLGEGLPNSMGALDQWVRTHGYQIFAMIRHPDTSRSYRTCLERAQARDVPTLNFKMLFLVPRSDTFFAGQVDAGFHFESIRGHP